MAKSVTKRKVVIEAGTKNIAASIRQLEKLRKATEEIAGKNGLQKVKTSATKAKVAVDKVASSTKKLATGSIIVTGMNQAFSLLTKTIEIAHKTLKFFIKDFSFLEQRTVSFRAITGSEGIGDSLLASLKGIATSTPISLFDSFEGAERLLAFGISVKNIKQDILTLGNIAAGVGKDKLNRLMLAFGQVKTAAQLTGQELRQFAEAGVPLLDELAKQSGRTAARIKEDMFKGLKPTFEEVRQALKAMTQEGGKFNNLLEKQAETIAGLQQVTSDKFSLMISNLSEMLGITELWRDALKMASSLVEDINDSVEEKSGKKKEAKDLARIETGITKELSGSLKTTLKGNQGSKEVTLEEDLSNLSLFAYMSTPEQVDKAVEKLRNKKIALVKRINSLREATSKEEKIAEAEDSILGSSPSMNPQKDYRKIVTKNPLGSLKEQTLEARGKEVAISKALLELEDQQQRLRADKVSPLEKESLENQKRLRILKEAGIIAIREEISATKDKLSLAEEEAHQIQIKVQKDGIIRDSEKKQITNQKEIVEVIKRYLKLLKDLNKEQTKASTVTVQGNPYLRFEVSVYEKAIRQRLKLDEMYATQRAKIEQRTAEGSAERHRQMQKNDEDYKAAKTTIDTQVLASSLSSFEKISSVFAKKSKSWFEFSKALGIGQALINTYTGITNALKIENPVLMWAQVAAVAATGFAQVASIESLRFGSKGSSSASFSGVSTSLQTSQEDLTDLSRRVSFNSSQENRQDSLLNEAKTTNRKLDDLIGAV